MQNGRDRSSPIGRGCNESGRGWVGVSYWGDKWSLGARGVCRLRHVPPGNHNWSNPSLYDSKGRRRFWEVHEGTEDNGSAEVVIVGPSKREFNRSFESEELSTAIVDEQPRADNWIENIREKTLIVSMSWPSPRILDIGGIDLVEVETCALSDPPQPPEHLGPMLGAITDRVDKVLRTPKEIADGPAVFPVNATVCIPNHHEIDLWLINCVEPVNHIEGPHNVSFAKDNVRACSEGLNHVRIDIGRDVDIDLPVREVPRGEINILKHSRIISRI